jgi:hypothetical protein
VRRKSEKLVEMKEEAIVDCGGGVRTESMLCIPTVRSSSPLLYKGEEGSIDSWKLL